MTPSERELLMTVAEVLKYNSDVLPYNQRRRLNQLMEACDEERRIIDGNEKQSRAV